MHIDPQLRIDTGRDRNSSMTDWIDDIKKSGAAARERAVLNERTVKTQSGRLWEKFFGLSIKAVQKFNQGRDAIELIPGDPITLFTLDIRGTNKSAKVWLDYEHGLIEFSYQNITDATSGKFYLEANPDGSLLLICPALPCDTAINEEDAIKRVLQPVFIAAA